MHSQPPVKSTEEKLKRKAMIATAVVIVGHIAAFFVISNMKGSNKDEQTVKQPIADVTIQPKVEQPRPVVTAPAETATVASSQPKTSDSSNNVSQQEVANALANHPNFNAPNETVAETGNANANTTTANNNTPVVPVIPVPNVAANKPTPTATVPATQPSLKVVDADNDMVVIEVRKPTPPPPPVVKTPATPAPATNTAATNSAKANTATQNNTASTATAKTTPNNVKATTPATTAKDKAKAEQAMQAKTTKVEANKDKKAVPATQTANASKTPTTNNDASKKATNPTVVASNKVEPKKVEPKKAESSKPADTVNVSTNASTSKTDFSKTVIVDSTPRHVSAAGVQWASRPTFAKQDIAKYLGDDNAIANVTVRMEADSKGTITHVSILQSSGNVQLDRYVLGQVKTSRVKPSSQPVITQLPFRLTAN